MTSSPSDALRWEVATFDALPDYPSSTPAGINGDQSHFGANTYHIGISEIPVKGGYTNRTWEDQMPAAGSSWHSSATDESMNTADMVKNWNRHLAVFNDPTDPRRQYIAEYIGWNGVGSAERLDFQTGTRTNSSADHKWHRHRAKKRRFYNSMAAAIACISIDKGETKAQYLASIGQGPMVSSVKEKNMILIHKVVGTNTTYAVVTANAWVEVPETPATEEQTDANALASVLENSKAVPADRYDRAKAFWLTRVVPSQQQSSGVITPEQVDAIADMVAAAVIAADTNELTEGDLNNVKESVKQAFREGTAV